MYRHFFKRLIDIIGALILLPIILIFIIIFAPIVFLTDRGPIFYNAVRSGKGYRPFKMFKLRSMYVNSPDIRNSDESTFNSDKDPRVTPIGRILRKTSIDELPQIINVLIGDMSFIGPRPTIYYPERKLENMTEDKKKRYSVKPGITGYAQAFFRNSISQDEKFKQDAYYAENLSFLLDFKVFLKSIDTVLRSRNIYGE